MDLFPILGKVTSSPAEADFILAHGTEAIGRGDSESPIPMSLDGLKTLLHKCAERERLGTNIPLIVANPDIVTVSGSDLITMPGTLAKWYREFGGEVHLMGKPASVIYEGALKLLALPIHDVLAIGDSLEHDIAGAQSAGITSVFVCDGIHSKETLKADGAVDMGGVMQLCEEFEAWPDFVLPRLLF